MLEVEFDGVFDSGIVARVADLADIGSEFAGPCLEELDVGTFSIVVGLID